MPSSSWKNWRPGEASHLLPPPLFPKELSAGMYERYAGVLWLEFVIFRLVLIRIHVLKSVLHHKICDETLGKLDLIIVLGNACVVIP